jgi:hypothetical protein
MNIFLQLVGSGANEFCGFRKCVYAEFFSLLVRESPVELGHASGYQIDGSGHLWNAQLPVAESNH